MITYFNLDADGLNTPIGRVDSEPYLGLVKDLWDDYGFSTLFTLYYITPSQNKPYSRQLIGKVKILDSMNRATDLPGKFDKLTERYCSLGQDDDYYNNLISLGGSLSTRILNDLRDCAYNEEVLNANCRVGMAQPLLSPPPSSNRTCRFPTSGLPDGFMS